MNNIVFIEGVSGVGKTTTTMLLHDKLRDMGYNVVCYLEGDRDNPLDPFGGTFPPAMPLIEFCETYLQCWQNFMENQFKKDLIYILDGTLFHHPINDLIRGYSASDEAISNKLSNFLQVIQPLNPIVFYLSSSDVGKCLAQARISRKQVMPTEEQIAFWENRKRVDLYVLDRLLIESHIINVDGGWNTIPQTIAEYVTV